MKEDYRKYSCFFPPFLHPLPHCLPVFLTFFFLPSLSCKVLLAVFIYSCIPSG